MTARIFVSGIFEIFPEIFGVVILYSDNNQHEISYIIELLMNPRVIPELCQIFHEYIWDIPLSKIPVVIWCIFCTLHICNGILYIYMEPCLTFKPMESVHRIATVASWCQCLYY
jgi:hypothetical protein